VVCDVANYVIACRTKLVLAMWGLKLSWYQLEQGVVVNGLVLGTTVVKQVGKIGGFKLR
jgi:hypothetical protein